MWRTDQVPSVHEWTDDFTAFINDLEGQFTRALRLQKVEGACGLSSSASHWASPVPRDNLSSNWKTTRANGGA